MERNIYLKMKTLEEAKKILFESFPAFGWMPGESISVLDSVGRILAEPVVAAVSSPNFHSAAMDGIAVNAEDTFGASESKPKILEINKNAFYINTGRIMPVGTNAVIMIENVVQQDDFHVRIESPVFPWQNVRKMGEDIVATELLFPRNHLITPYCIGAIISAGVFSVVVRRKPKVLIIPTGSELVDWRQTDIASLQPGQVLETNSYVLGKLTEACGGSWTKHDTVMDDVNNIKQIVTDAIPEYDMILTIGGSSAGSEDYAKAVISDLGEILIHGVTIMPGKPVIIGKIHQKPVIGIPGYPVSAIIAFEQFVQPLINRMLGQEEKERTVLQASPTRKIPSKLGIEEFVRVKLGLVKDRYVATPLPRAAGCITTITKAEGIIRIPNHMEGISENSPANVELLRPLSAIRNTIVIVGSHDNTLDVLADEIRSLHGNISVSSSHVGSMGGLMAIKRGGCHVAGTHLLDTENGTYNISYIKRYLPDIPVKLINLVLRDQGLIVAKGNPKGIKGIEDLVRKDITFINRQGGSGTRILLDYRLKQLNISPESIIGYRHEEFTHMSVAVAVLGGTADVGLGIFAAAKALNLDFIPVVTEQYDLVIPEEFFQLDTIQFLLDVIRSKRFKDRVESLGGYHTTLTGKEIF